MSDSPKQIETLSFEEAIEELESVVRSLEDGKSPLDVAISSYERGVQLKKHCEEKLREATLKVEKILISPEGTLSIETLEETIR